ncbi:MAG TPA: bifunctional 4-hydroxy-2-oxoglutarate aldolase/2-dehydro-3-deoxy-phosphogluconate aldolase, partial [Micropruina sp.]|nr:bifunctional 4-hydroxy-2-oxoglutarate aldolase/2-dehydro-3-deoxy-phosphogluconate aldolase [Micropruina sp.]HMR22423.1 bifunctional 4-hydroxy-2-oxoglutarate aldolase/2-dehydro-3-deoxy-phosphogluconate aldolase [Micropruina sp.]
MEWLEVLAGSRVIVELPAGDPDDLIAAGEVLIQEGLAAWTLPFDRHAELGRLRAVFGRRARLGVSDLRTTEQLEAASGAGADLLLTPFAEPALVEAAGEIPVVLGGLTPSEVARALSLGPAAVQVIPCDALGSLYARTLTAMFPEQPLIATGKLERFQCEMWLEAGALAVCPAGAIGPDDIAEPDLAELRHRCQGYRFD